MSCCPEVGRHHLNVGVAFVLPADPLLSPLVPSQGAGASGPLGTTENPTMVQVLVVVECSDVLLGIDFAVN